MQPYRILSVDGGGVRGIFAAAMLEKLRTLREDALDRTDLMAGTSTGGIVVLGLAHGLSPREIVGIFSEHSEKIFSGTFLASLKNANGFYRPEYRHRYLKELLESVFGEARLGDLERGVLIPAFALDNGTSNGMPRSWHLRVFHNLPGDGSSHAERVVDVALRTSAAPMYFPTYQGHIDGGVVANNPALAALTHVRSGAGAPPVDQLRLLSVGTGLVPSFIAGDQNWGVRQWLKPLMRLMVEGGMGIVHQACEALLGDRYHRLDPVPPVEVKLDDTRRTGELLQFAESVPLEPTLGWIADHF